MDKRYNFLTEQIRQAEELRDKFNVIDNWETFTKYYRGDYEGYDYVYNMFYTIPRAMIAQTYRRNPKVVITSDDPRDFYRGQILEKLNNIWIREQGFKTLLRRIMLDTWMIGYGVIQIGSGGEFGRSRETLMRELKRDYGDIVDIEIDDTGDEYHDTSDEYIWAKRVPPCDVLFSPESLGDINNDRFFIKRYYRLEQHIKKDRRYVGVKKAKFNLVTYGSSSGDILKDGAVAERDISSDHSWVELFDFFDRETDKIYTIASGHDKIIKKEDIGIGRLPFAILRWTDDPDYAYPQSDARVLLDKQQELNEINAMQSYVRNSIKLFLFINGNKVEKDEIEAIQNGSDPRGVIFTDGDPDKVVWSAKHQLPPDIFSAGKGIENDAKAELGFSRNQLGQTMNSRTTAAEANIIAQSSSVREDERSDMTHEVIEDCCKIADLHRIKHWKTPRSIYLQSANKDIEYTNENLYPNGDLNYEVVSYESQKVSSESRRMFQLQAIGALGGLGLPPEQIVRLYAEALPESPLLGELSSSLLNTNKTAQAVPSGSAVQQKQTQE